MIYYVVNSNALTIERFSLNFLLERNRGKPMHKKVQPFNIVTHSGNAYVEET